MKQWAVLCFAVPAVGLGSYWAGRSDVADGGRSARTPQRSAGAPTEPAASASAMFLEAARRARAAPAEEKPAAAAAAPNVNASATEPTDEASEEAAEQEKRAQAVRERQQFIEQLDLHFEEQAVDAPWSYPTENRIKDAVLSIRSEEARLDDVECRSDVCRLTLTHDAPRARAFVRNVVRELRGDMELQFGYEDGRTTIYALRPPR